MRHPRVNHFLIFFTAACVFLFNFLLFYRYVTAATLLIGTARVDITPNTTVWLSGFASRNHAPETSATITPLYARALSIQQRKSHPFVIVSLDVIGFDRDVSDRIYALAWELFHIPRERLRLCATHTHSGPVIGSNLYPLVPSDSTEDRKISDYAKALISLTISAINQSLAKPIPATIRYGTGLAKLAVNRAQIPERRFQGERGVTNDNVPVLWFVADERVIAGIWGYSAHATVLTQSYTYSPDYPGIVNANLESDKSVWMYMPGCGGDQNIYPRGTVEYLNRHGQILSKAIRKVMNDGGRVVSANIQARRTVVQLPFAVRYTAGELRERRRSDDRVTARAANGLLEQIQGDGKTPSHFDYPIGMWRLGHLKIAFLGGEPTVGYCSLLKEIGVTWVVGYCEHVMGYVGTKQVIQLGGREGGERAAWYYGLPAAWKEDIERIIVVATRHLL